MYAGSYFSGYFTNNHPCRNFDVVVWDYKCFSLDYHASLSSHLVFSIFLRLHRNDLFLDSFQ